MISIFKRSIYKNGYLLIIAAWLYTISFIFSNYGAYSSSENQVQKRAENYLQKNLREFQNFSTDTLLLNQVAKRGSNPVYAPKYLDKNTGLFIYTYNEQGLPEVNYWSTNKMLPDDHDLLKPDGMHLSVHNNGYFVFVKNSFFYAGKKIVATALIPVLWDYKLNPKYLPKQFVFDDDIASRYNITTGKADVYIKIDKKVLFGLIAKQPVLDDSPGAISLTLRVVAIIFVLIFFNLLAYDVSQRKGWVTGFTLLVSCIVVLRGLSYVLPFPFSFRNLKLFDASVYASNWLHPSLGDLFINVLFVFWFVSFVKFAGINDLEKTQPVAGKRGWWMTAGLSVGLLLISFSAASLIRSLIKDSQISFDVTNFFSLDIFSLVSFVILCLIVLSLFHLSHIVLLFLYKCVTVPAYVRYVFVAVIGLLYLSFSIYNPTSKSNLAVLLWLLAYMLLMELRKTDITLPVLRSSYFLVWVIFFAASISALIIYQNSELSLQQRKKDAERLATIDDPNAQNTLLLVLGSIDSSFLSANFKVLRHEKANRTIKDSLSSNDVLQGTGFFDTHIYVFDEKKQPLYNDDSVTYYDLRRIIDNRGKKTSDPHLYAYEKEPNSLSYIYEKAIVTPAGDTGGYFIVVADSKKNKTQAVYPVLVKSQEAPEHNETYAIYNKGQLMKSEGDYDFASYVAPNNYPKNIYDEVMKGNTSELWYNAGGGKLIITVKKSSVFLEFVTLFAYLFAAFLFIVIVIRAGRLLVSYRFRLSSIRRGMHVNIRHQIQGAIIFISIFSFIVIGFSTITFYTKRFTESTKDKLVKSVRIFASEIESELAGHNSDNEVRLNKAEEKSVLEKTLQQIAEAHGADANVYDMNGSLEATTQPNIYRKEVFAKKMEPEAYQALFFHNKILFIKDEKIGQFSFSSVYVPLKNKSGNTYAYLNMPYLNTQIELNQEISNFLVTLINLNAFIFVIAGAISVLLTNRITNSFTLIGSKMKEINLGAANEEIMWNKKDEIGVLVNEYNKMVNKLGESAEALAKSEREGAWREMARQVAHEIKNPLTPMKLSIQYLQRAIRDNSADMQERAKKVAATLVEQIDQLAKIASDFSQFANISNVKIEVFDVNEVLGSLVSLYSTNQKLNITYHKPHKTALIQADKNQMNRLFTNLFQNAIEASDHKRVVTISIQQEITGDNSLLIHFADEGCGISAERKEKIFTPNFTTKSSGTGLGLAICKGIVEKANGKIWFDTKEGEGTTFHVLLPLAE